MIRILINEYQTSLDFKVGDIEFRTWATDSNAMGSIPRKVIHVDSTDIDEITLCCKALIAMREDGESGSSKTEELEKQESYVFDSLQEQKKEPSP